MHGKTKSRTYCHQLHIIDGLTQAVPEGIEHISSPTLVEIFQIKSNGEKEKITQSS
jgi:hypothetical protein